MPDKSKEQYEAEINDLFKRYSQASGSGMEAPRKTLLYRLMDESAKYILSGYVTIEDKEEFGVEIFETIKSCINFSSFTQGDNFVHYLMAGLKRNLKRSGIENRRFAESGGIQPDVKTARIIKAVLNQKELFTRYNKTASYEEMTRWIGKNLGLKPETVQYYLDEKSALLNARGEYDGKNNSIFDFIRSDYQNPEETFFNSESQAKIIHAFNEAFSETQERVQPFLRELLSAKYGDAAQKLNKKYPFFDFAALEKWTKEEYVPAQKEIAQKWNRLESAASRVLKNFEKKVQEKLSEK